MRSNRFHGLVQYKKPKNSGNHWGWVSNVMLKGLKPKALELGLADERVANHNSRADRAVQTKILLKPFPSSEVNENRCCLAGGGPSCFAVGV